MALVRLPRYHSVSKLQKQVVDALKTQGEPAFVIHTGHSAAQDSFENRCPSCFDPVYLQASYSTECPYCFGTGLDPAVIQATLTYVIFSDNNNDEKITKQGEFLPVESTVVMDGLVEVTQNDFILRVDSWKNDKPTSPVEAFTISRVSKTTLRDGMRRGDYSVDIIQQKGSVSRLTNTHPIYKLLLEPWEQNRELSFRPSTPARLTEKLTTKTTLEEHSYESLQGF